MYSMCMCARNALKEESETEGEGVIMEERMMAEW